MSQPVMTVLFQHIPTLRQDLANQVKFSREYQSYVAQGHAPGRFLSVGAGEWFSGRDQALAELLLVFFQLDIRPMPWVDEPTAGCCGPPSVRFYVAGSGGHRFLLSFFSCSTLDLSTKMFAIMAFKAGKQPMISLFSGVGGLDLGLSQHAPQFTDFFSCSTFAKTLHFMRSMKFH